MLDTVRATPYDDKSWEHYRRLLQEEYAKDRIQTKLLKEGLSVVSSKNVLDVARLQDIVYGIQECINLAEDRGTSIKSIGDMFDAYQNTLSGRVDGRGFYPTGCTSILTGGNPPTPQ